MSMQFFAPKDVDGRTINIPSTYRRTVRWLPQIGDVFPNFKLPTTQGIIDFWPWAEGSWVLLFGHPAAKTPVCTTEIGALSAHQSEFEALNTKLLGLTGSGLSEQAEWHKDIERLYNTNVWFPTAADVSGQYAELFGMIHEKEHMAWPVRKSFLLDPQMTIRAIFEYPVFVGRSVEETLRVIEAVQLYNATGLATPSDWFEGDPLIAPEAMAESEVRRNAGQSSRYLLPYLRVVKKEINQ